ncbi:MAG: sporulation integral membrane protein YtvI [Defluviitaleaceae bacterium]|nr:sporulation integral membrane protein YtvI [Defluviitaleaceae bacterium]
MREFYRNNTAFIHKLLLLAGIAVFFVAAVFLAGYVVPFVVGYIISLILSPLVGLVHRKWGINRGVAATVLILALLGIIGVLGTLLVGRVISEMAALVQDIPNYIGSVQALFDNMMISVQNFLGNTDFEIDFSVLLNQLLTIITGLLQGALDGGGFFVAIPVAILRTILAIISAYFFIKDKERIKESFVNLLPERLVERGRLVREGLLKALVGYFKGQLIVMAFVSTICVIGLTIIGSPYALFIGMGIAVFDLIPIFGAGGILIPWALYNLLVGNFAFGIALLVIYGIVFLVRQILEPRVVGQQIGMHPLILLISVYVGITTMGPVGILSGPLIALTIKIILESNLDSFKKE